MRLVIYTRLSVADDGLSHEVQEQQVSAWATQHRHTIEDTIRDDGVSGGVAALRRSGFALASALVDHGRADLIVAAKLDRIGRSMLDVLDLIERRKVPVFTLDLPGDITSSHGGLALHMLAAFAEAERRRISERTTAALHGKIRRGERVGRESSLTPRVRQRIVSMRAEGMSLSAIARRLNEDGVPTSFGGTTWRHPSVHAVLATHARHRAIEAAA